jgi:hypothetical protein
MIVGTHVLLSSKDADADRAFFRDVLSLPYIDVGGAWLIFALPPAEAAIHPIEGELSENRSALPPSGAALYLMCDDLQGMIASLRKKNVECTEVEVARWGMKTMIPMPSGGHIGLYQPRHATALNLKSKTSEKSKPSRKNKRSSKKRPSKKR